MYILYMKVLRVLLHLPPYTVTTSPAHGNRCNIWLLIFQSILWLYFTWKKQTVNLFPWTPLLCKHGLFEKFCLFKEGISDFTTSIITINTVGSSSEAVCPVSHKDIVCVCWWRPPAYTRTLQKHGVSEGNTVAVVVCGKLSGCSLAWG